ncbi:MAG TPA: hypothetical protein ENN50_01145 [Prosthecochloris aestuarii]|uniref:Glucosamine inositolphosphorylceramide transferase 1 N-terminal domain-containing protein n=1 Tax=Prosthecochloris aestuarii TaxID=1102 RepID=A0A831SNY5_PROAE|nr:hypothetical protein [Prosthecochloris aestuarii]
MIKKLIPVIAFIAGIATAYIINDHRSSIRKFIRNTLTYNAQQTDDCGHWSIGIYEGPTPFDLAPPPDVRNPVLTCRNVSDVASEFVADPFMIARSDSLYMFFEVLNKESGHGDIGYATSRDARKWQYHRVVLDETYYLSYPYVFLWDDEYFMIPESHQDLSVKLYRASSFPEKWEYAATLLSGYHYVDPSIVRRNDTWWMFVSIPDSDVLNLYYAKELTGPWTPHPMNPIVKFNKHSARPAGRLFDYQGRLYRVAQDDAPTYGIQVFAYEITSLSETYYKERPAASGPLITKTGSGWNAEGMHHIDVQHIGGKWIGVVDGRNR